MSSCLKTRAEIHLVLCEKQTPKNASDSKGKHSYFNQEAGSKSGLQEFCCSAWALSKQVEIPDWIKK